MRNLFLATVTAALLFSCSGSTTNTGSPKAVVNAFIESAKQGDLEGIKKYITGQDAKLLDMGMQFMGMLDSAQKNSMKEKMESEFKDKMKDVTIEVGNEKIEGDNATVDVSSTKDGKKETHPFALKKENGQWKISFVSTGMKSKGMTQEDMDTQMNQLDEGMKGMNDSIAKALNELKRINPDSLKQLINEGVEKINKINEATEKNAQ